MRGDGFDDADVHLDGDGGAQTHRQKAEALLSDGVGEVVAAAELRGIEAAPVAVRQLFEGQVESGFLAEEGLGAADGLPHIGHRYAENPRRQRVEDDRIAADELARPLPPPAPPADPGAPFSSRSAAASSSPDASAAAGQCIVVEEVSFLFCRIEKV